jgi:hypothetical protein
MFTSLPILSARKQFGSFPRDKSKLYGFVIIQRKYIRSYTVIKKAFDAGKMILISHGENSAEYRVFCPSEGPLEGVHRINAIPVIDCAIEQNFK